MLEPVSDTEIFQKSTCPIDLREALVIYMTDALRLQVLEEPHPKAETVLFYTKDWPAAAVAVMNVVYAFSGQSAYIEIIAEMKGPHRFPSSLSAATSVMVVAYFGIGIAGYVSQVSSLFQFYLRRSPLHSVSASFFLLLWKAHPSFTGNFFGKALSLRQVLKPRHCSQCMKGRLSNQSLQGATVDGIIIFDMGSDWLSRLASGAVFIQAIAQYLVTLNIWSHNILLLLARRRASRAGVACTVIPSHTADLATS